MGSPAAGPAAAYGVSLSGIVRKSRKKTRWTKRERSSPIRKIDRCRRILCLTSWAAMKMYTSQGLYSFQFAASLLTRVGDLELCLLNLPTFAIENPDLRIASDHDVAREADTARHSQRISIRAADIDDRDAFRARSHVE